MVLDPRNSAAWDLGDPAAERAYVVASVPRCGSTLLCRTLWDTQRVGAPKEYLNPMQVRDWEARLAPTASSRWRHRALRGPLVNLAGRGRWDDDRLRAYLHRVRCRRSGGGWFGLKLHHHHFRRWFLDPGRDVDAFLGPTTWVRITREDRVAQAVSWARALQTGRWASYQGEGRRPVYQRRAIARQLRLIEDAERGWDRWFELRGLSPVEVDYDSLVRDRQAVVRRVLSSLHIPGVNGVMVPAPTLTRQADALSAAWVQRFREGR